ncbi:hypothetical protein LJC18_02445 [Lachnospiraceae bacterium OttesenSCG-928-E19]|nr:hypothetical protein [Lachnospiraceae bacterium OttesenSCG-928-E19]
MNDRSLFEKDQNTLAKRTAAILQISKKYDPKKIQKFAQNFKNWILDNMSDEMIVDVLNWPNLMLDERKKLVRQLVFFLAEFRQAQKRIKSVHFKNIPDDAEYTDGIFTIKSKLLLGNNFNDIIGMLSHEMVHMFQRQYQTTLSREIVDVANDNYVQPDEDEMIYDNNPIEIEAVMVEKIIRDGFIEILQRSNNLVATFSNKNYNSLYGEGDSYER